MTPFVTDFETTSATFLPFPEVRDELGNDTAIDLSRFPMAERIRTCLEKSLVQLACRARRLGPVDGGTIVLLTGNREGVGCSTLCLALAAAACAGDGPVALVDADFRHRGLTRQIGQASNLGWEEMVRRRHHEIGQAVDHQHRLAFFPLGVSPPVPDPMLTSSGLAAWFAWLRQEFALVILDGGCLSSGADQWAPWVDAAAVVCRSGPELSEEWAEAWDRLEERGAHVLGIVETFV